MPAAPAEALAAPQVDAQLESLLRSAAKDAVDEDAVRASAASAGVALDEFVACVHGAVGASALHIAAARGNTRAVRTLVALGGARALAAVDRSGGTALLSAAAAGHSGIVDILLSGGADANIADARGHCALHEAADCTEGARVALARALLGAGADVNAAATASAATALHVAAATAATVEAAATISVLLEHGADGAARTAGASAADEGETPLDIALRCRHWAAAAALLGAPRINEPLGRFGRCVLHHATMFGALDAVQVRTHHITVTFGVHPAHTSNRSPYYL